MMPFSSATIVPPRPTAKVIHADLDAKRRSIIEAALKGGHDYDTARGWAEQEIPQSLYDEATEAERKYVEWQQAKEQEWIEQRRRERMAQSNAVTEDYFCAMREEHRRNWWWPF